VAWNEPIKRLVSMVITAAVSVKLCTLQSVAQSITFQSNQIQKIQYTKTNAQLVPVFPEHVNPIMCIIGWSYELWCVYGL